MASEQKWKQDSFGEYRAVIRELPGPNPDGLYIEAATADYLNRLESERAELVEALRAALDPLATITSGLRSGDWWGQGSGELEDGELYNAAEAVIAGHALLARLGSGDGVKL